MLNINKKHWNKFYLRKQSRKPSTFARFINKKFLKKNLGEKKLIDIGCGSGRDSFFFAKKIYSVTSLDKSNLIIKNNNYFAKENNFVNVNFIRSDVNKKNVLNKKKYDYIYLRFFMHAIDYFTQKKLFKLLNRISKKNSSLLMFEFRTINDPLINKGKIISKYERINNHYRRFINSKDFIKEIMKIIDCKLIYKYEGRGISKVKKDNPHLCRLVFKRK